MNFQFPFQLFHRFIIVITTIIIETQHQIQSNSIKFKQIQLNYVSPCPLATLHGVEERQGSKSAVCFATDFD